MHSRVTLLEIDTLLIDADDAVALFSGEVVPRLEEQDGYAGAMVLATPEGKGMIISFWTSEAAAEAAAPFAAGELERYVALFRSPPGREHYEVAYLDLPHVAA
jgi:hypothetical protein